jgi:hypothetical protein
LVCAVLLNLVTINTYNKLPVPYLSAYYFLKVHLHHFAKIKMHKDVKNSRNQGFLTILLDNRRTRISISDERIMIRIQEAQKHTDPTDPDPQHWFLLSPGGTWHCGGHAGPVAGSAGDPSMR